MLSEPLTTPPRRYQQYLMAALVAIIFSFPFHVTDDISTTPQLALLIGNLIAFYFGQRGAIELQFASRNRLSADTYEFRFTTKRPLRFSPGQYIELSLPHSQADSRGIRRMFSIVSTPKDKELRITLRTPAPASTFKQSLMKLSEGSQINATMIAGNFVLPKNTTQPILMIAGGIGITPFMSQLKNMEQLNEKRPIKLIYLVSDSTQVPYFQMLTEYNIQRILVTDKVLPNISGWECITSQAFREHHLREIVPNLGGYEAYISGPPMMVEAVYSRLHTLGLKRIHTDHFSGY